MRTYADSRIEERKRRLRAIIPPKDSRLMYVEHFEGIGHALYHEILRRDLEGIVAKHRHAPYSQDPTRTTWVKIGNPDYSQAHNRDELFASANCRETFTRQGSSLTFRF